MYLWWELLSVLRDYEVSEKREKALQQNITSFSRTALINKHERLTKAVVKVDSWVSDRAAEGLATQRFHAHTHFNFTSRPNSDKRPGVLVYKCLHQAAPTYLAEPVSYTHLTLPTIYSV